MRQLGKIMCFLALIGLPLGFMHDTAGSIYQLMSVSPCASKDECQDQYVHNIDRCLPYYNNANQENFCGDAIDPAYLAVNSDWPIRQDKFREIANAEKQKLSPEVLQTKQERIREALKQKWGVSETKVLVYTCLSLAFFILPFICCLVDWLLARKARKTMFQGEPPSVLIMLSVGLFLAALLGDIAVIATLPDVRHNFGSVGILLFLIVFACLLAIATKREVERFKVFVRAVKRAKA